ncbi:hypothetical protein L6164_025398 [Bauhinia variegata]|uniref:Uncharacterized protein n=1 Tax=Bauhinia variegata TaxID=167791 RepID=A0ACB9M1A0_BAUVA|nr:hypothetical protein L6164_025398 [Bauhinia variegata]
MIRVCCYWFAFLALFLGSELVVGNDQFAARRGNKVIPYRTIMVDQTGWRGNFSNIQSAIDSVPSNNRHWVCIKVRAGTYREKLKIPYDKPYIILLGEGMRRTLVVWDDHGKLSESPTLESMANNVVVKFISFRNSYNNPINRNPRTQAVAARIGGDKSYFYNVGFFGLQDTLWDDHGRHYYELCTFQGAVDFIFGNGQSIFETCSISVIGPGFITAQARSSPHDTSGFVFKNCNIFGNGTTYLGRPWRSYARVVFYNTKMSNIVQPKGWHPSRSIGHE